jgi:UDP-glucose 4-epimerase
MAANVADIQDWRARRCLVTGAGGFLGLALSHALVARGAEVHASGRAASRDVPFPWHQCDVADAVAVRRLFSTVAPDTVFHLASRVTGTRDLDLVAPILQDNLVGTVNVLVAATQSGRPRVICLGSLQEPDMQPLVAPGSPYGAAKLAASAYARMFAEVFALPVSIARPFMAYGAGQTDLTKLVPYVVTQLLRNEEAALSSGMQAFDWVYVDDVVEALLATAATSASIGKTVDIGCGVLTSVRDVAMGIATRLNRTGALRLGAIPDRRLEQTRCADTDATAALIHWRAQVPLEEGLDRSVAWYRQRYA